MDQAVSGRESRLSFYLFVAVCVAMAAVAGKLFLDAYQMGQSFDPPPLDRPLLSSYEQEQTRLLEEAGWADDLALGGQRGETERSKALGLKRIPIEAAMAAVQDQLARGTWMPDVLSEAEQKKLDRIALGGITPEELAEAADNEKLVSAGREVFAANCVACHAAQGQGLVGPNLTDEYFLHGSQPIDMYKVIKQGIGAKGMPPWGHLGDEKVKQVTAYVATLPGKNVDGKPPQGEHVPQ